VGILGRRSGKTTTAIEFLYDGLWDNPKPKEWPLVYAAPYRAQAKDIAWNRFKQHLHPDEAVFKESDLVIYHKPTGCSIYLIGCDKNPDRIRGWGVWRVVVDEIKDIPKYFMTDVLRPALSDTEGKGLIIGTPPKVKGISYEYHQRGLDYEKWPDWISWNVSSAEAGIISLEEIEKARYELDPESFEREYGAAFQFLQGLVVKHFSSENIQAVEYQSSARLHISCDFNVDPCMWVLAQRFPPKYHFIDEIVRENTTINEMCDDFARRYPPERVKNGITINGDASGNNRNVNTERKNETSYTILRNRLSELGFRDVRIAVRPKNPGVQDRVEAFNAKIMNANGETFIYINPRCKHLIANLENLHWVEGTSDIWEPTVKEIEKDRQLKYTKHIYDAASYIVEYYDPIRHISVEENDTQPPEVIFDV